MRILLRSRFCHTCAPAARDDEVRPAFAAIRVTALCVPVAADIVDVTRLLQRHFRFAASALCVEAITTVALTEPADGVSVGAHVVMETWRIKRQVRYTEIRLPIEAVLACADARQTDAMTVKALVASRTWRL